MRFIELSVVVSRENDGRFLAACPSLPGVLAYGYTFDDAVRRAQALALRVEASRLTDADEPIDGVSFEVEAKPAS